jgi:hypothetical protein
MESRSAGGWFRSSILAQKKLGPVRLGADDQVWSALRRKADGAGLAPRVPMRSDRRRLPSVDEHAPSDGLERDRRRGSGTRVRSQSDALARVLVQVASSRESGAPAAAPAPSAASGDLGPSCGEATTVQPEDCRTTPVVSRVLDGAAVNATRVSPRWRDKAARGVGQSTAPRRSSRLRRTRQAPSPPRLPFSDAPHRRALESRPPWDGHACPGPGPLEPGPPPSIR